jgi:hypothetical protein
MFECRDLNKLQLNLLITNRCGQKRSLKASFRYYQLIYKEIYAIGQNYMIRYKRQFVITE